MSSSLEVALKISVQFRSLIARNTARRTFLVLNASSMWMRINVVEELFRAATAYLAKFAKTLTSRRDFFPGLDFLFRSFVCHHGSFLLRRWLEFSFWRRRRLSTRNMIIWIQRITTFSRFRNFNKYPIFNSVRLYGIFNWNSRRQPHKCITWTCLNQPTKVR